MILNSKQYGNAGKPLLILHGLYGQQGNWASHAKVLAETMTVFALDARNHGLSPWEPSMTLQDMAADVAATMDSLGLDKASILGHSMGGKTAMLLALLQPERVSRMIVVDIAPVAYLRGDSHVLEGLAAIDLTTLESRSQADAQLGKFVESKAVRDFLLSNLQRDPDKGFRWRFNLAALQENFSQVIGWPELSTSYQGEVLFIRGSNSKYILPEHQQQTLKLFPKASLKTVEGAGHWVHSEKPETFLKLVTRFLDQAG